MPHGRANAILLPYVIKYNSEEPTKFVSFPKYEYFIADIKYANIAKMLGLDIKDTKTEVDALIKEIKALMKKLGIPSSLKEAGVPEQEFLDKLDILAENSFEDQCTGTNPRMPLIAELKEILLDAYYGK